MAVTTIATPEVIKLTPTSRPSAQAALTGQYMISTPARIRSEIPLASIQPHEPGIASLYANEPAIWKTPSAIKNAVSTIVSDSTPAAGFQISGTPTAIARAAVSSVQKNAGTSRAENIATSPTVPLIRNSQPM